MTTSLHRFAFGRAARLCAALLASLAADRTAVAAGAVADPAQSGSAAASEVDRLVARGEAVSGTSPKEAWEIFRRAWALDPRSPAPPRAICRLALGLGISTREQRSAARNACETAQRLGGTPEDMRNRVAATVIGEPRPSMEDVALASLAADGASRVGPGQLWGPLARADLALRLGERDLLDAAVADLRRIAPEHPQTRRLVARASAHASFWIWLGRIAVGLLLFGTVAHALARGWASRRRGGRAVVVSTFAALLVLLTATRAAASPAASPIDDAHPEASIPGPAEQLANPLAFANLITELGSLADAATKKGDHAAAARYYTALAKAVPNRAYSYANLCDALAAEGRRAEALIACRVALTRQDTSADDYARFVRVLLAKRARLDPEERKQADIAVAALDTEPRAALIAARVRCNIATHEHDLPLLEACTATLSAAEPNDARTLGFAWALALEKHDLPLARRLGAQAVAAGLDRDVAANLRRATGEPASRRWIHGLRWALGGALSFLALLLLVALVARSCSTPMRGKAKRFDNAEEGT